MHTDLERKFIKELLSSVHRPAEIELLILCSHTKMSQTGIARAKQVILESANFDWEYLLELARQHAVQPLLYLQLEASLAQVTPPNVLASLHNEFKANAYKNIKFSHELGTLIKLFKIQNIPILAFKGPVLGELAYHDYSLRQFMDLDILVPESHVTLVRDLLERAGYRSRYNLGPTQQSNYIKMGSEQDFWNSSKQIIVDLHWSILPKHFSFTPSSGMVWSNSMKVELDGQHIETLSLEDLLLFLCAHGAKHNWESLNLLCDLAEILDKQPSIDWEYIKNNAGRMGSVRMLRLGLFLAHYILEAEVPEEIIEFIEIDHIVSRLAQEAVGYLFPAPPSNQLTEPDHLARSRFAKGKQLWKNYRVRLSKWFARDSVYLGSMENWRDKLWFWSDIVTPTPLELVAFPLPKALFFLYYPLRPLRLITKYLSGKYRSNDLVP